MSVRDPGPIPKIADLKGKRFLFTAPRFFSYEFEIVAELERRGAHVDFFADRPFNSPFLHVLARFSRKLVLFLTDRHNRKLFASFSAAEYDHVFIINGQTLSYGLLQEIRRANPQAFFTFYLWDSLRNRSSALELLPLFDRAYSFEIEAARAHGLRFRPLFFCPAFEQGGGTMQKESFDLSFIGTAHSDRYAIIRKIEQQLDANVARFWFLYLQAQWVFWAYRFTKAFFAGAKMAEFRFNPLNRQQSSEIFWQTKAVVDIEHPRQNGLTMRTLETVGARKKLITTNAGIRKYALYDPSQILIVDRNNPVVPPDFLLNESQPLPDSMIHRYSLAGWIDEIFSDNDMSEVHLVTDSERR